MTVINSGRSECAGLESKIGIVDRVDVCDLRHPKLTFRIFILRAIASTERHHMQTQRSSFNFTIIILVPGPLPTLIRSVLADRRSNVESK